MTEAVKNIPTGEIKTAEEAVAVAEELNRMEAVVNQLKTNLKAYVDKNGEVQAGNTVWKYSESVSWKIKPKKFPEVMKSIILQLEVDPWEMVSLPKTALNKLGWDEDVLMKYATKKITNRFGAKKI